jgi:acetyl esterase/lipase
MFHMNLRVPTIVLTLSLAAFSAASLAHAQQTVLPLWPHATPEPAQTTEPEADITKPTDVLISGHRTARLTNVTVPTLSVYPPRDHSTGAAALVFPGGAYMRLVWDGEGIDACKWLNSLGITCLLVKYRVPEQGRYPDNSSDLEDAQQAMRLARAHAADWHIDPTHIGVMGFSAGANLAVLLSTHPDDHHVESTPAAPDVDTHISARADFAILVYPAYLAMPPEQVALDPVYTPNQFTPATFLIQAENDRRYGKNALVYYRALMDSGIPAQLHYYATGGHGFGMHPIDAPEEHWSRLAATWLRSINVLPSDNASDSYTPGGAPCPVPQPPPPGRPATPSSVNAAAVPIDPNCW